MRSRTLPFTLGVVVGGALGWIVAQQRFARHRRDLFSRRPLRRLAALGFLAGQADVETVHLLRDYLAWERQPVLRRRAQRIVRDLEATLA